MSEDIALLPATRLVQLYRTRSLSPVEVIQAVFDRIRRHNPVINAFCWLDEERALTSARESEARWRRGEPQGLVDGVPTSVKDLSFTAGWPTRRACRAIREEGPWHEDSPSVARMRAHGAVLFGKTTVPEFATTLGARSEMYGITRNPWNPAKTPGGSSAGAAASIPAGMGTIGLASDAAGSVRIPPSFTGVFGLKPTFGLVPDYPSSYLGTLAVIGPITRTVEDCALTMTVISESDPRDSYALPYTGEDLRRGLERGVRGLRIAYSPTLGFANIDPEVAELVEQGVRVFSDLGASVELVEKVHDDPMPIIMPLLLAGLANAFRQFGFTEDDLKLIGPSTVAAAQEGARMLAVDYLAARRAREHLGAAMRAFHERYHLLLAPVTAIPPFDADVDAPREERYARLGEWGIRLNAAANLTKQPAATVPCGFTRDGLPVGLQIIGPLYGDALVLRASWAFETARPFRLPDMKAVGGWTRR